MGGIAAYITENADFAADQSRIRCVPLTTFSARSSAYRHRNTSAYGSALFQTVVSPPHAPDRGRVTPQNAFLSDFLSPFYFPILNSIFTLARSKTLCHGHLLQGVLPHRECRNREQERRLRKRAESDWVRSTAPRLPGRPLIVTGSRRARHNRRYQIASE